MTVVVYLGLCIGFIAYGVAAFRLSTALWNRAQEDTLTTAIWFVLILTEIAAYFMAILSLILAFQS